MSIADQAAKQLPHAVTLIVPVADKDDKLAEALLWCADNCEAKVEHSADSTWRGGPAWNLTFRFARKEDATLFKLFWS